MFCLHFLNLHKSDHPENPTSKGRHRNVHLDIFSLITNLLFIKWDNFEIDVQELFWASIYIYLIFRHLIDPMGPETYLT